jgi:hypothetical protein
MAKPPPRAVRSVTSRQAMPSRTSIVPLVGLPVKRRAYRPAISIGCCDAARPTRVSPMGPLYPPMFAIGPYPKLSGASRSIISHVAEIVPLDAQRRGQPLGSASSISTCLHSAHQEMFVACCKDGMMRSGSCLRQDALGDLACGLPFYVPAMHFVQQHRKRLIIGAFLALVPSACADFAFFLARVLDSLDGPRG